MGTVAVEDTGGTMRDVVAHLKELGLTEHEARIYLTLVTRSHMTVTDISRDADIPMSKIYGILARLETGGWISVIPERPKKYGATDPRIIVDLACRQSVYRLGASRDLLIEKLGTLFDQQEAKKERPEFQVIHGSTNILNRFREIVSSHPGEVMIHLAFVDPAAAGKVIDLAQELPGKKQIFIIDDHRSLGNFSGLQERYDGVELIVAPERHAEGIMFVYTDDEGMYCSLKDDEFVMALSILDRGFLSVIRKFGEIAHPQIRGHKPDEAGIHENIVKAHKAMFAGTAGRFLKHRKQ